MLVIGGSSFDAHPTTLSFDITYRCNLRCTMCHVWELAEGADRPELTTDEILRFIGEFQKQLGIREVRFLGGEPLIRQDLPEIIERLSPSLFTEIVTNGTLITRGLAERLVDSGLSHIRFSIDGPAEIHDGLRGKGAFDKAIRAIDVIQQVKREKNTHRPRVTIWPTISKVNCGHLEEIYRLATKKEAGFHFHFLVDRGGPLADTAVDGEAVGSRCLVDPGGLRLSREEEEAVLSRYLRLLWKRDGDFRKRLRPGLRVLGMQLYRRLTRSFYLDCSRSIRIVVMDPWGELFPCEHLHGYSYGNGCVEGPSVWLSAKRKHLRRMIEKGVLPVCRECNEHCSHRYLTDFVGVRKKFLGRALRLGG